MIFICIQWQVPQKSVNKAYPKLLELKCSYPSTQCNAQTEFASHYVKDKVSVFFNVEEDENSMKMGLSNQ